MPKKVEGQIPLPWPPTLCKKWKDFKIKSRNLPSNTSENLAKPQGRGFGGIWLSYRKNLVFISGPNNHVVPYNHVGWTISLNLIVMWSQLIMWGRFFPQSVKNPILLCIKSRNSKTITYYQTKVDKTFVF